MTWEAVTAVGSIAGALILLVGTLAALMQLRHLRLTYQIESYLAIMSELNSPEMVAAREFVLAQDVSDRKALEAIFEGGIDQRIVRIGGFLQIVSRLINQGVADPTLFAPVVFAVVPLWRVLRPIADEYRRRSGYPRWLDVDVLVYNAARLATLKNGGKGYPQAPLQHAQFAQFIETYQAEAAALTAERPA